MKKILSIGDFTVSFYKDYDSETLKSIETHLINIGVPESMIKDSEKNLSYENTGITFANCARRKIIVIIGPQTDKSELLNTLAHEIRHVVDILEPDILGITAADLSGEIFSHFADWV